MAQMSISTWQSISHLFLCNHVTVCKILTVEGWLAFCTIYIGRFPNTVRGDRVFHGLAGKKIRGGASEDVLGREHQRHLREAPPQESFRLYPELLVVRCILAASGRESCLREEFARAELPNMSKTAGHLRHIQEAPPERLFPSKLSSPGVY